MINKILQKNKVMTSTHQKQGGFTLIETLVAVFLITLVISSFMSVTASSLFSTKYMKDEITANYLLQEVVDFIRKDRDSTVLLGNGTWDDFKNHYGDLTTRTSGFHFEVPISGVDILPTDTPVTLCAITTCPIFYYKTTTTNYPFKFYSTITNTYETEYSTTFRRNIIFTETNTDQLDILVTVRYQTGGMVKTKTLKTTLTKWQ